MAPVSECDTLGFDGICVDENTVRYCGGSTDEDIVEIDCFDDKVCEINSSNFAICVDASDPCDDLDVAGICDGDTLKYCLGLGGYNEIDCSVTGQICEVSESGFANCSSADTSP